MNGLLFASIVLAFQYATLGAAHASEELGRVIDRAEIKVVVLPFEILERGSKQMAKSVPAELERLLRKDSRFAILSKQAHGLDTRGEVTSSAASVDFQIAGSVYAGAGGRNFVALRIEDGKTEEIVWSENYDYTSITAEMMATSAVNALVRLAERRDQ